VSINIGIIISAATFSTWLSRVSHPDCRATLGWSPNRSCVHSTSTSMLGLAANQGPSSAPR